MGGPGENKRVREPKPVVAPQPPPAKLSARLICIFCTPPTSRYLEH
jgi:hypothetical protein